MSRLSNYDRITRLEREIQRKEALAKDAKNKGMQSTFSNYKMDLSILKSELQKLRTNPNRLVF